MFHMFRPRCQLRNFGQKSAAQLFAKRCASENAGGTCQHMFHPRCQLRNLLPTVAKQPLQKVAHLTTWAEHRRRCQQRNNSIQKYLQQVAHLTTWPGNFGPTSSAAQLPSAHVKVSCVDGAPCICGVFMEFGGRSGSGYCHVRDVD